MQNQDISVHPLTDARLQSLISAIDFSVGGLEDAFASWRRGDKSACVKLTAAYFRGRLLADRVPLALTEDMRRTAEDAVSGRVVVVHIPHEFAGGEIDWRYDVTKEAGRTRDYEWVWQLNRMNFWQSMAAAYASTADERYPRAFVRHLRGWVDSWSRPSDSGNWVDSGWRTIECGLRLMSNWPKTMSWMASSLNVLDEDILLYLWSSLEQVRHLMAHPSPGSNWLTMEMNGIYTFASMFPEFTESAGARKLSMTLLYNDVKRQILPDGGQWELSPSYHKLSIDCSLSLMRSAWKHGFLDEVPSDYLSLLEKGYEYLVNIMTPSRGTPHPNDSADDIDVSGACRKIREIFPKNGLIQWAAAGAQADAADRPGMSSQLLPWSGYCVMRGSWSTDAAYCFFDVGTLGYGHWHQDKLHIELDYLGENLLFDDGGGNYERSKFRSYACSAWDHSVVCVDGLGQWREIAAERKRLGRPMAAVFETTPEMDFAEAVYDDGFGPEMRPLAIHRRQVLFVRPDIFIVCDRLTPRDDAEHHYESRWQVEAPRMVESLPGVFRSERNQKAELVIAPLLSDGVSSRWETDQVGDADNEMSGVYVSLVQRPYRPAVTVSHERTGRGEQVFLTLLLPVKSGSRVPVAAIRREEASVEVSLSDGRTLRIDGFDGPGRVTCQCR